MLVVLVMLALGLIATAGILEWSSGSLSSRKVVETNTKNFYAVERSINAVTAWLQNNSKNMLKSYLKASDNFDLPATPAAGTNQGSVPVPTMVKMKGNANQPYS